MRAAGKVPVRRFLAAMASAAVVVGTGSLWAAEAKADGYVMGCERIGWGFFMSGYRTICDGPKRPDGSWDRTRREWTPAHWYTPYCSSRAWICPSPYFVGESTQRFETYPVSDAPGAENAPLQGEPGWLPSGSVVIR